LIGNATKWENLWMTGEFAAFESFVKLADNLKELEVTVGEKARPAIAAVRARLLEAVARSKDGDDAAAITALRDAMGRLAALGGELDPDEGALMRLMAERFTQALGSGDKDTARHTINFMRYKAGDKSGDDGDW
jgi:hypothetical protein